MSKLDFLKPLDNFQYSINLEFDQFDDDKIKSFLPTSGTLDIIDEILTSVLTKSEKRSRLLTGAYGKGKSHLTLTLLALLSGRDKKLFKNLFEKAKQSNETLYNNIKLYIETKRKLLPIIINTSSDDLKANLLNSLSIALKKNGMSDLMPTTFFDVAIEVINNWNSNFIETYKNFENIVGYTGNEFISELKNYNQDKYNLFVEVYPALTSGSEFNPMQGTDVIKTYESVISEIKKFGFTGIFIVYDEFGKFLEGSLNAKTTARDIKLLQDLGERCSRSELDKQMNLLLISHKGIDNYVGQISKENVDSWKAIGGRFEKISIQSQDSEVFEMIAQVLKKDAKKFDNFVQRNVKKFAELDSILRIDNANGERVGARSGAFNEVFKTIGRDFIEDCYPLHPYSLLMLPKISELVAQNERTIFTYLSANDKNTVSYFAKRTMSDFPIIEPDAIYDYFEPLFKGEAYGSPIREQWQMANAAIAKLLLVGNALAIKIVKTIALIYIIDQFETLPPSSDLIYEIFSLEGSIEIQKAFEIIKQEELLIELEFKPFVRIRKSSNNNIIELIEDEKAKLGVNFDEKKVLIDNMSTQYFYPVEYNDELEITRYFKFVYINHRELISIENINLFIKNIDADGVILAVLLNDEDERVDAIRKVQTFACNRVIFILPKEPKLITEYLKKYNAICNLIDKKKSDDLLVDELLFIKEDLNELIKDYIEKQYIKIELKKTEIYYNTQKQNIVRRTEFTHLMSTICRNIYVNAPTIINENINKNLLSATMKNTRKKIIIGVLSNTLQPRLGLVGSQDINVFRSVYVVPGIIANEEKPVIVLENCNTQFQFLFNTINEFILSTTIKSCSFSELYYTLINHEKGIGLKRGVIPFYLALILRERKGHAVIYSRGRELEINADLVLDINETPELFQLKMENWNDDKEQYVLRLRDIFCKHTQASDLELSVFEYASKAMQRWYLHLSKFDRETKYIYLENGKKEKSEQGLQKLKTSLGNPEINAREFLFDKLPKIVNIKNYRELTDKIKEFKNKIDLNSMHYIDSIKNHLRNIFKGNVNASLTSILADYFEALTERTKEHVFSGNAAALIDICKTICNDESKLVKELLKGMYSLRLEDFTDSLADSVIEKITEAKKTIDDYNENLEKQVNEYCYTVVFEDDSQTVKKLQFDKIKGKSYEFKMLYSDITSVLDDFNESLTKEEKGQILLEILKEMCK